MGVNGYLPPVEQACHLINQLARAGGVDLLLFCVRGNRITATVLSNYRLFYEVLCRSQVPIALVVTHLEREPSLEGWWERNVHSLEKYGIRVAGHACVTGLPEHFKYRESHQNVVKLLQGHGGDGTFQMPPEGWLIKFLRAFGMLPTLKEGAERKDIISILTRRCGLDPKIADTLERSMKAC